MAGATRGWHLYAVELPRPDSDYRNSPVEITDVCARRTLTIDELAHAERQLYAFLEPYAAASRTIRSGNASLLPGAATHSGRRAV
ncbi:hypothetical protein [Streptomyces sp. NPDC051994]|uniref:hypothetical protein n=1 Tax=unclassified Streptomyces TaxID=2593676 RepID=UPI00341C1C4E